MKEQNIYLRTGKLAAIRFALAMIIIAAAAGLLTLLMMLGRLFDTDDIYLILFIVWIPLAFGIWYYLMHRFGYLVKNAYIAIGTEALVTGRIPASLFERGTATVHRRFTSPGQYDIFFKMLSSAIGQLRRAASARDRANSGSYHAAVRDSILYLYSLYLRDCCIGYTFYRRDTNAYLAAADGCIIAYHNRKYLQRDAVACIGIMLFSVILIAAVLFPVLLLILRLCNLNMYLSLTFSLIFSFMISFACKYAFIDTYLYLRVMRLFLGASQVTAIVGAMYSKLSEISGRFDELLEKGQRIQSRSPRTTSWQTTQIPTADYRDMQYTGEFSQITMTQELQIRALTCPSCGKRNIEGSTRCAACGFPLGTPPQS